MVISSGFAAWAEDAPATGPGDLPPIKAARDAGGEARYNYRLQIRQLFNQSNFAELENAAAEARRTKELFGDGYWRIQEFYEALKLQKDDYDRYAATHEGIYAAWETAYPKSITARVAHAAYFTKYGWEARGDGFASSVTPEGGRLFQERIDQARKILDEAAALETKCPIWWYEMLKVARAQGWKPEDFEKLATDARDFAPGFWYYDLEVSYFYLPEWYGKTGDWERRAEKDLASPGAEDLATYARLVFEHSRFRNNVFDDTLASWEKTRKGFEELLKRYPGSLEILSQYAKMAWQEGERELTQRLFREIGGRMVYNVWGTPTQFAIARSWAFIEKR